jgi:hypothetical protein
MKLSYARLLGSPADVRVILGKSGQPRLATWPYWSRTFRNHIDLRSRHRKGGEGRV